MSAKEPELRRTVLLEAGSGLAKIEVIEIKEDENSGPGWSPHFKRITFYNENDWKCFQAMVNRAANTWDRAPAKMKSFMDIVTEGKEQQKYEDLGSEVKPT